MQTEVAYVEEPGVEDRFESHGNIEVEEVTLDEPGDEEVLVDVKAVGVCHSDWHVASGDMPTEHYPCALGHEGAGVIEDVGDSVTHVEPGDRVVLSWIPSCGKCRFCSAGHQEMCTRGELVLAGTMPDGTFRMHKADGTDVGQFAFLGCYAEHIVTHGDSVTPITEFPDVPMEVAAVTGCAAATGFGAAVNRADIEPGDTVVHFGLGGVGAAAVQGSRREGADQIVVVDPSEYKREKASEFGATHTVDPEESDPFEFVQSITDERMADVAIFTGSLGTPEALGEAYSTTKSMGQLVSVSNNPADATTIDLPEKAGGTLMFTFGEREIIGTLYGGWGPNLAVPTLLEQYEKGNLQLGKDGGYITDTYSLDDINEAYDDMIQTENIRGIIELS